MSDERLRELERRWQDSGTVEDEASYLLERARVGELSPERLQLAAYCGHPAALHATGAQAPPSPSREFFGGLVDRDRWGAEITFRVLVALAAPGVDAWRERFPADPRVPEAFGVLVRVTRGDVAPPEEVGRHLEAALEAYREWIDPPQRMPMAMSLPVICGLREFAGSDLDNNGPLAAGWAMERARLVAGLDSEDLAWELLGRQVLGAVASWALGSNSF
ncbi:MAG: hypothetical protein AB7N76_28075 [Planctomycetota bacterium]